MNDGYYAMVITGCGDGDVIIRLKGDDSALEDGKLASEVVLLAAHMINASSILAGPIREDQIGDPIEAVRNSGMWEEMTEDGDSEEPMTIENIGCYVCPVLDSGEMARIKVIRVSEDITADVVNGTHGVAKIVEDIQQAHFSEMVEMEEGREKERLRELVEAFPDDALEILHGITEGGES